LLGTLGPNAVKTILLLKKTAWPQELIKSLDWTKASAGLRKLEQYFHNNEFRKFWLTLSEKSELNKTQIDVIHPASEKLIKKYSAQEYFVVNETSAVYSEVVKPYYISKMDMSHNDWIYNVLNGSKEKELRVFENDLFMLQKDWKYNDGDDISTLYCLALVKQKDLLSIRDLTAEHLPLLKSIVEESVPAISKTFDVPKDKILAYFHYHPTYYHLHVHFVHI
jgi:m7GpppX diphosphatase